MRFEEEAADLASYEYPFALDSQNVKNYTDYFKVDDATAQYNLTVGMASNEALTKVLDQLDTNSYDYVFEEDFAKGLVLPIEIKPDGVKSDVDPHAES